MIQTQCVVLGGAGASVDIRIRFLHITVRTVAELMQPIYEMPADGEPPLRTVDFLEVDGQRFQRWQEAEEREIRIDAVELSKLCSAARQQDFSFSGRRELEAIRNSYGRIAGALIREQQPMRGSIEISAESKTSDAFVLAVRIHNLSAVENAGVVTRDDVIPRSLASVHAILDIRGGEFVSMTDPPKELAGIVDGCKNIGTWPVLVGDAGEKHTLLSSPIILSDYPEVAPESPGDLFDATEIDEILTLRILTLTEDEKREAAALDARARRLLARTEALSTQDLMRLHGTFRDLPDMPMEQAWELTSDQGECRSVMAGGVELKPGDRVRLWPQRRSDIFDVALRGMTAVIARIEQDYEGRIFFAVTIEDDPGADLGLDGKIAHRFFFAPEEVELLDRRKAENG
jgi:hypothetical protein